MGHDLLVVLIDVLRLVGVAVALLGAVITAPSGTHQLVSSVLDVMRRSGRFVMRHLPWHHRRDVNIQITPAGATSTARVGFATATSGSAWSPDDPIDEKIERLRKRTEALSTEIEQLRTEHRNDVAVLRTELDRLKADHQGQLAALRAEQAARDRQAAKIDATGLPLIGLGIVLTGWPDQWLPTALAAFFLFAVAVVVASTLKRRSIR